MMQIYAGLLYYLDGVSLIIQFGVYKFRYHCQLLIIIFNFCKSIGILFTYTDNAKAVILSGLIEFIINALFLFILLPVENIKPNKVVPITYKNKATESCSICLEPFVNNTKVNKTICGHMYHVKCIDNWLLNNNSCPNCRTVVLDTEITT